MERKRDEEGETTVAGAVYVECLLCLGGHEFVMVHMIH